jgi:hypothetical protein
MADTDRFGNSKSLLDAVREAQKAGPLSPIGAVKVNYTPPAPPAPPATETPDAPTE